MVSRASVKFRNVPYGCVYIPYSTCTTVQMIVVLWACRYESYFFRLGCGDDGNVVNATFLCTPLRQYGMGELKWRVLDGENMSNFEAMRIDNQCLNCWFALWHRFSPSYCWRMTVRMRSTFRRCPRSLCAPLRRAWRPLRRPTPPCCVTPRAPHRSCVCGARRTATSTLWARAYSRRAAG